MCVCVRVCVCVCVCEREREREREHVCARVLERVCAPAHPCQLHLLHNHRMPMQCQLYNSVGSNQGLRVLHGCESLFLGGDV